MYGSAQSPHAGIALTDQNGRPETGAIKLILFLFIHCFSCLHGTAASPYTVNRETEKIVSCTVYCAEHSVID